MTTSDEQQDALHPNEVSAAASPTTTVLSDDDDGYYGEGSATLGDRIAAARANSSLTQAGLAHRLGVGVRLVSDWENDRAEPRANRLAMLSGLLGVSVTWLLTGAGEGVDPPGENTGGGASNADTIRLCLLTRSLDDARAFYGDLLGCGVDASEEGVLSVDFFGAQLTARLSDAGAPIAPIGDAPVDDEGLGAPHVGVQIDWEAWVSLVERLRAGSASFAVEPAIRGVGEPRERACFMIFDPTGNALAFHAERATAAAV